MPRMFAGDPNFDFEIMRKKTIIVLSFLMLFCGCDNFYTDNINGYVYDVYSSPIVINKSGQDFNLYYSHDTILPLEKEPWKELYYVKNDSIYNSMFVRTHIHTDIEKEDWSDFYLYSLFLFVPDSLSNTDWQSIRNRNLIEKRIDINYHNRFDTIIIERGIKQ